MDNNRYSDREYLQHRPLRSIGSEYDGSGDGVEFSLQTKEPKSNDQIPNAARYNEFR